MHFFPKAFSSIQRVSTNDSSGNAGNSLNNRGQSSSPRKLTRQRKLRHVSDQEVGLQLTDGSDSPPCSPVSARKPPSPGCSGHLLSSAEPQPLPLPELHLTKRPESSEWNFGGSPEEGPSSVFRRNRADRVVTKSALCSRIIHPGFSQDANVYSVNCGLTLNIAARSAPTSGVSSPMISPRGSNGGEHSPPCNAADSTKSSTKCRKGQGLHLNIECVNSKLSQIVYHRSAPTSGFSSPAVSPQRSYTGDFLPSIMASQTSPIWLDLEVPALGRPTGQTSQVSTIKTVHSPDRAPIHSQSLQIPHSSPRNRIKFSFPSHNKLLPGNSKEWSESNNPFSAHPLPLPPGATPQSFMPVPLAILHNTTEKPNVSLRTPQWQKGKPIGRGTYGSVYVGTNRETGALCAMKEVDIIPDDPKSAECIKQLEQEIRLLRRLEHPNIVQYYGSEIVDDHFYIYLEYVYPGSISRYVHEHCGVMTESIVRNFTRHILSGLAYLHSTKTIHRDIKGANLLVNSSGIVKLADFGMAKHLTGLSYELSLKGSPHWMAPEVIKAVMQKEANPDLALAVDIWSLGCTIIEMFTGKPPWGELQGPQAMFKVLNRTPPIPQAMSPEAKNFLCCCFRRNPAERPSASALLGHPFVRNSSELNLSACRQALSTISLVDKLRGSRDCAAKNIDLRPASPSPRVMNDKLRSNGNLRLGAMNNHLLALLRSNGREVPHI